MGKHVFKMTVMREMPGGGATTIEMVSYNPVTGNIVSTFDDIEEVYQEACRIIDVRHLEMNMRIIESSGMRKYFTPEEWQKVVCLFDILAGRTTAAAVVQRWEDIAEENRELEAARALGAVSDNGESKSI
jgi:hypothetical protein